MADASANRDVEIIREKQRFKKYWVTETSRKRGKPYFIHKASGIKCWPEDWKQVVDGVHPTSRYLTDMGSEKWSELTTHESRKGQVQRVVTLTFFVNPV